MSRFVPEVQRISNSASDSNPSPAANSAIKERQRRTAFPSEMCWEFWFVRLLITAGAIALCYRLAPFGLRGIAAAVAGFCLALVILLAELRFRRAEIGGLLGGVLGTILGMFAALLVTLVIARTEVQEPTKSFLEFAALFAFAYLGLVLGAERGGEFRTALPVSAVAGVVSAQPAVLEPIKLLDTSVLIDGRIADVCEAHFLDGVLGVPQFVLHELQLVADSADSLKRQRGRRGLEVLQRMQKMPQVEIRILDQDLTAGDVDHKLVELARRLSAKIVTNDFNLNKVATVQGLSVLNVNQLANALKPVVLPGEPMRVLILREGKEINQGVAYLDDGTMVVVDGGRRLINKIVDIQVTSVHQTTAGKMIFGRVDDRQEQAAAVPRQAAAAAGAGHGESAGNSRNNLRGRMGNGGRLPEPSQVDRGPRPIFRETDTD
ncbi:MAG TPA: TRAM domain-containing protein [Candidatus Acidoferrum sp.]